MPERRKASRRASRPEGLENLINDQWRLFPGKTGVAVMRIDGGVGAWADV